MREREVVRGGVTDGWVSTGQKGEYALSLNLPMKHGLKVRVARRGSRSAAA